MFTLDLPSSHQNLRAEKMKHMYRHLYMHPTKKGKPQITARGGKWGTINLCNMSNPIFLNLVQLIIHYTTKIEESNLSFLIFCAK